MKSPFPSILLGALVAGMALLGAGCSPSREKAENVSPKIVASTSWTGLLAKTAGADTVTTIAPVEMKHPNEYDFKPSDLEKTSNAQWVIYSEYEPFMKQVFESKSVPEEKQVLVVTENTPDNLKKQVEALAQKFGTQEKAKAWETDLDATFKAIRAASDALDANSKKAVVQAFMVPVAQSMGYEVIGVYGPAEVTPAKATELAALKPAVIIDNFHMPQGGEIAKISGSKLVELRNFPESEQQSMIDLIKDNAAKLGIVL